MDLWFRVPPWNPTYYIENTCPVHPFLKETAQVWNHHKVKALVSTNREQPRYSIISFTYIHCAVNPRARSWDEHGILLSSCSCSQCGEMRDICSLTEDAVKTEVNKTVKAQRLEAGAFATSFINHLYHRTEPSLWVDLYFSRFQCIHF